MLSIWQQVTATALLETKQRKKEIPNCHQSNFWSRSDPISALGIKSSDFFFPPATWFCSFYFLVNFISDAASFCLFRENPRQRTRVGAIHVNICRLNPLANVANAFQLHSA
jgi:hypothetical protein